MAVRGDDLVNCAPELDAVQGVPCRVAGANPEACASAVSKFSPVPESRSWESPGKVLCCRNGVTGHSRTWGMPWSCQLMTVMSGFVRLEDNWTLVAAFDVSKGLERNRN